MKKIKININIFNRYFSTKLKKTLSFLIRIQFMESKNVNISVFNRYLILSIVVLFSYLFYLSVPTIYDYGILQKDLNEAEGFVERMLANRDLSVDDVKKNYMTLVYFNRPWALRETMEVIAEGNTDLVVKSQLDSYKKNRSENIPDWFTNRINKEIAFVNEFDDPTESGGNATDTKEPITIYLGDKPQLVDPNIADQIVKNTDYTYEPTTQSKVEDLVEAKPETPVSVEEGQREKEVKDVLTAHIYSYLQKQKNVYESQVPKEAGPIDVARVKTDIRRAERE